MYDFRQIPVKENDVFDIKRIDDLINELNTLHSKGFNKVKLLIHKEQYGEYGELQELQLTAIENE